MSSSDRITCSKGKPEELSLPARKRQRRKSPNRETQTRYEQTTYRFCRGIRPAAARSSCHVSPLPAQPPRPTSSQSITGPITGERPHSRALSVAGTDEGCPSLCHHQRIGTSSCEFLQTLCPHQPEQTHHRYHSKNYHNILAYFCLNYLLLYLQKTNTALALTMTRRIVMQKSARLYDSDCHHK